MQDLEQMTNFGVGDSKDQVDEVMNEESEV